MFFLFALFFVSSNMFVNVLISVRVSRFVSDKEQSSVLISLLLPYLQKAKNPQVRLTTTSFHSDQTFDGTLRAFRLEQSLQSCVHHFRISEPVMNGLWRGQSPVIEFWSCEGGICKHGNLGRKLFGPTVFTSSYYT